MKEWTATITEDDLRFVETARRHYEMFAEASEGHGDGRTAGLLRKQEFYAERFALRIQSDPEGDT